VNENDKPPRDWKKNPYNTWDTAAAMIVPPLPLDKGDGTAIEKRLERIEATLARIAAALDIDVRTP